MRPLPMPRRAARTVRSSRVLLLAFAAAALSACSRAPRPSADVVPARPVLATPEARALAIYRTVADSIYVRTTARPIAVVATSLDTACTALPCTELADRWGVGSIWWENADSSDAASARDDLLAHGPLRLDLRPVAKGTRSLVSIEPGHVPLPGSDVAPWIAFRDGNHAAAGALHFSPVGFGRSGRTAIVYVDWRCGPTCGHGLSVVLRASSDSTWRIDDMLLLSSLQR